jgi:hypothetical protein
MRKPVRLQHEGQVKHLGGVIDHDLAAVAVLVFAHPVDAPDRQLPGLQRPQVAQHTVRAALNIGHAAPARQRLFHPPLEELERRN